VGFRVSPPGPLTFFSSSFRPTAKNLNRVSPIMVHGFLTAAIIATGLQIEVVLAEFVCEDF
jgi:hypothetical protein